MTHAHRHTDEPALGPAPIVVRVVLAAMLIPLVAATAVGLWLLWPSGSQGQAPPGTVVGRAHATVLDVHRCQDDIPQCQAATVDLTAGVGAPGRAEALLPFGAQAPTFAVGDEILLSHTGQAPPGQRYQFIDFDRTEPLALLVGVFVVGVLVLSRWRGVGSLASLAFSLLLIAFFTLPALLGGASPLTVAVVTAAAIMIVTLYLSHGFNVRTGVAMLGTLLSLLVTGVLGAVFTGMGDFTGLKDETSGFIGAVAGQVDLSGLLLAGLVIGALGVLDDVTVTQASAVWELADAEPHAPRRLLFTRAMRIGRSHVASTVNTLVLAYVGATLPLLLVFSVIDVPFGVAVSQEQVAQEVVRSLVGGLGIIAAVPLTTGIAALVAGMVASAPPVSRDTRRSAAGRPGRRRPHRPA